MSTTSRKPKVVAALLAASLGVGALGLSQATMTSAAVSDVATATSQNLATGNVLPRTTSATCSDDGQIKITVNTLTPPFQFRMYLVDTSGNAKKLNSTDWSWGPDSSYTWNSGTGYATATISFPKIGSGETGENTAKSWVARVYTVNGHNQEMSDDWVGYRFRQTALLSFQCKSILDTSTGPVQGTGLPGGLPQGMAGPATFTTLMDTLNSDEMLEPLPEDTELADLDAAAVKPAPTSEAMPTESGISTTKPSPTSPSAEAAPSTEADDGSTGNSTSSSTRTAPSTPRTSTRSTTPAATSTSSQAVPTTRPTVSATKTTTVNPQPTTAPPATTTAPTVRAGIGDDPIGVGDAFARLDEVDGQPQLVVSTAGGAQVCTAELPGATRITSAAGKLTVTVDGRTHTVDTGTCAID